MTAIRESDYHGEVLKSQLARNQKMRPLAGRGEPVAVARLLDHAAVLQQLEAAADRRFREPGDGQELAKGTAVLLGVDDLVGDNLEQARCGVLGGDVPRLPVLRRAENVGTDVGHELTLAVESTRL